MTGFLRLLARLLAPSLRRAMGPEIDLAIAEAWAREARSRGLYRRLIIAARIAADTCKQIVVSRLGRRRSRFAHPSPLESAKPMGTFLADLSFGVRGLIRAPLTTAVMLTTLALGIGGSTTVFTLINAELVQPLPYRDHERLVAMSMELQGAQRNLSAPDLEDIRERAATFVSITGFDDRKVFNVTGNDQPVRLFGASADASFFETLGVEPILGRTFRPDDDLPGAARVVVIGEGVWRSLFAADPEIVGSTISLNELPYTVVGIAPATLKIPDREQLWVPLATHPYDDDRRTNRTETFLEVVGRLAPGTGIDAARAEMEALAESLAATRAERGDELTFRLTPLRDLLVAGNRSLLTILMGAVAAVLLLAGVNVAVLQLGRAAARRQELGVRLALGATRGRIARQLLTEAMGLSAIAGALGVGLAVWSRQAILAALPDRFPRLEHIGFDATVLTFAAVATLGTATLFALAPTFLVSPSDPSGGRARTDRRGTRIRRTLVAAEVALALALLVNAGLLTRSLFELAAVDNGYDGDGVLTASLSLPESRYDDAAKTGFYDEVLRRLEALPAIESAAAVNRLPVSGGTNISNFFIEDRGPDYEAPGHVRMISLGYFETMRIPITAGRAFEPADLAQGLPVAIVDVEYARRHWPDGDALGARIRPAPQTPWFRIVGIAGATRHWGPRFDPEPTLYAPYAVAPEASLMLALRTTGDASTLAADLREIVWSVDPAVPIEQIRTMDEALDTWFLDSRASTAVFAIFSALAVLLALVGIYGVLGQSVAQRTREVGVRMAVGASRRSIHGLILWEGLRIAALGVVVGIGLALGTSRAIAGQLYGVRPSDPLTFATLCALLLLAAATASITPARRATRIDPVESLRSE